MAQIFSLAPYRAIDANGNPLAGALLYFYQTGTSTPQTVYSDSAATTPLSNPVVADAGGLFVPIYLASTNLYKAVLQTAGAVTVQSIDPVNTSNPSASFIPQGRLTLASGTPVMTSDQTAVTTIYYTPYVGNQVPVYDGTQFTSLTFTELTNITTNSAAGSAGPAAVTTNSNYDLFVWSNASVATLTRGPAWTSDTARGTGASTAELTRVGGVWVNAQAVTNGPVANRGTYVGTVRSDGSSQINWKTGGVAVGGTAATLGVWNAYNRAIVAGAIGDATGSWVYTATSWHPARSQTTMRASFVQGLQEDAFNARYLGLGSPVGTGDAFVGVGFNTVTAINGVTQLWQTSAIAGPIAGEASLQGLGFNYAQAMENSTIGGSTFFGNASLTGSLQTGLTYNGRF